MHLKIGTRGSQLAVTQTKIYIEKLQNIAKKNNKNFSYEIIKIKTKGDKILNKPLYDIGGKALFVKELENALELGDIDLAIHSLKDIPGVVDQKFYIGGYICRRYPYDCLISKDAQQISQLKYGALVGTSSPRRKAFLHKLRPDLKINNLRGNINSRLAKFKEGLFDAIILAEAGIRRCELFDDNIMSPISPKEIIPAVGQGVLCAQVLSDNQDMVDFLQNVTDKIIEKQVLTERAFLAKVNADCDTPVAAYIDRQEDSNYLCSFMLSSSDFNQIEFLNFTQSNISEKDGEKIGDYLKAKLTVR